MKAIEQKRTEILQDRKKGLSFDKIATYYGFAKNTIIKYIKKWEAEG